MSKITLQTIANLDNPNTVVAALNSNFATIQAIVDLLVSRDGTSPNSMLDDLDVNSHRIINLPEPTSDTEPARHGDLQTYVDEAQASATAAAASATDAATKDTDVVAKWTDFLSRYVGSSTTAPTVDGTGQALVAGAVYFNSATDDFYIYNDRQMESNGVAVTSNGVAVVVAHWIKYPQNTLLGLTDVSADNIASGQLLYYTGSGLFKPYDASNYDISFFVEGLMSDSENLFRQVIVRDIILPAGLSLSLAKARVAASADAVLTIQKNGVSKGTVTFANGATSGTFSFAADVEFSAGDIFSIVGPTNADTSLSDVSLTLIARRA